MAYLLQLIRVIVLQLKNLIELYPIFKRRFPAVLLIQVTTLTVFQRYIVCFDRSVPATDLCQRVIFPAEVSEYQAGLLSIRLDFIIEILQYLSSRGDLTSFCKLDGTL